MLTHRGIGPDTAATLLITAGDNPGRLRSEASFAAFCGVSPEQASSGKTTRHRLNRGGDRQAGAALYRIALSRLRWDVAVDADEDGTGETGNRDRGLDEVEWVDNSWAAVKPGVWHGNRS